MAAALRAVALRQKMFNFCHIRPSLNTIQQLQRAPRPLGPPGSRQLAGQPPDDGEQSRHPWDFKLSPILAQLILTGSALSFMLYFFVLREESDVDTAIYRPIWERVPDISPEVAERMLEMDRQLGILYDAREWEESLRQYKKRYYANHPELRRAGTDR